MTLFLDPDSDLRKRKKKKNSSRFFKQKYLLKHQAESKMTNEEQRHSRSTTVLLEHVFKSRVSTLKLRAPKSSSNAAVHIAQKSDQEMTSQPHFQRCGYDVGKQGGEAIPALSRSEYEPHLGVLLKLVYRTAGGRGLCLHAWQPFLISDSGVVEEWNEEIPTSEYKRKGAKVKGHALRARSSWLKLKEASFSLTKSSSL